MHADESQPEQRAHGFAVKRESVVRMVRFGIVGASGILVNQGLLVLLHGRVGWPLPIASAIAIETSILSNFALNSRWTWKIDLGGSFRRWLWKGLQYHAATVVSGFAGNGSVLLMLVYLFDLDYRLANLAGIFVGSALNFAAGELWVFRDPPVDEP
jgi:dolichol-phosphate mannosyltransferase